MKLIILDRDGSINSSQEDYVTCAEEWQAEQGALEAIARLNQAGYTVVVASNQAGLGRGLFDVAALNAMHAKMHKQLGAAGGRVDAIFYCPHGPEESCTCRKPQPGLFLQIGERYGVPLAGVPAAGDNLRDLQAGVAAGCEPHLLLTGRGAQQPRESLPAGTQVHDSLAAFADYLIARDAQAAAKTGTAA
ncbi:D-glycero-beta-D-manno-heptose 1,7-bisphosphate 7-phosphatase [Ramlibacter sp. H39-3-26]|uniref:D-glycero-beta-D-manno-heptose 1,7-bisphosphate 7-phosphatase n=1 Tax=Curvibacter soli TaxID=3031331 RepID=UPI0023D9EF83|nr:D-glycero-beta-D-manno-heptose 1,7-bisphosphate 7-phosphatase [Ramlibacter sp. H39-3-26]MDF1486427.1 D-glycero-beta-D-manno-heptose 1,7-bisphosphate 7-phosphatase [Ramlibacter sp. H39-3-26]